MKKKITTVVIVFYWVMAAGSFGHSASNCTTAYDSFTGPAGSKCDSAIAAVGGIFAGAAWPLYLSWVYFEGGGDT
jgi:hypothetical protein